MLLELAVPEGSEITRFPRQLLETCTLTGSIIGRGRDGDMNSESIRVLKGSQEVKLEYLTFCIRNCRKFGVEHVITRNLSPSGMPKSGWVR